MQSVRDGLSFEARIVALTRLHFTCLGADLKLAEAAVLLIVGRRVPDAVLAAQLVGYLLESLEQCSLTGADINHPTSGFFGESLHIILAEVGDRTVEANISNEQDVAYSVG